MARLTLADLLQLRESNAGLVGLAQADLASLRRLADEDLLGALHDLLPGLIDLYAILAASVAADWYDQIRDRSEVPGYYRAAAAGPQRSSGAHALIGWAAATAATGYGFWRLLEGGMQRRILNQSRLSVMGTALGDPAAAGWYRVGVGENCRLCTTLIGRDAVYTEATADFETHDNCNCIAAPDLDGSKRPRMPTRSAGGHGSDGGNVPPVSGGGGENYGDPLEALHRLPVHLGPSTTHIINGDHTGGGHMYGVVPSIVGKSKSWFPKDWSQEKVLGALMDVAGVTSVTKAARWANKGRWINAFGEVDRVRIKVRVDSRSGLILTGHALDGDGVWSVRVLADGTLRKRRVPYGANRDVP